MGRRFVVGVVGVAAAALTTSGCLDDGVPDLKTAPIAVRADQIIDSITPGETIALATCPVDDHASLIEDSLDLVDDPVVVAVLEGEPGADVTGRGGDVPAGIRCTLRSPAGSAAIEIGPAPATADARAAALAAQFGQPFTVDESRLYRGGRFHRICSQATGSDDTIERCEVAWTDDLVIVSIVVTGPGATDLLLDDVEERYSYMLPLVVDRFAAT